MGNVRTRSQSHVVSCLNLNIVLIKGDRNRGAEEVLGMGWEGWGGGVKITFCIPNRLRCASWWKTLPSEQSHHLTARLTLCVAVCLTLCLSICLTLYVAVCLTLCVAIGLTSVWLSVHLSQSLSGLSLSSWLADCLMLCLSVCLPFSLSVCPSVWPPVSLRVWSSVSVSLPFSLTLCLAFYPTLCFAVCVLFQFCKSRIISIWYPP